jgi:endonuclease-3
MTKKEKTQRLVDFMGGLKQLYPDAPCALEYEGDAWKLLCMARLSAQCTDKRVNAVCKELFKLFPTAHDMANGDLEEIKRIVKPCGLYQKKAENLKDSSRILIEDFNGIVPDTMDGLLTMPGVGRKIANLILGDVYSMPAIVCDTHFIRILGRVGIYKESLKDAGKIEKIIRELLPDLSEGSDFCHRVVIFGREICTARSPQCKTCPLSNYCLHFERENANGKA